MAEKHVPVLLEETIAALNVRRGGRYVDGTLGRGGHTRAIIERGGEVLGIDRDDQALDEIAASDLGSSPLLSVAKGNHDNLLEIAKGHGWNEVDGILLDLGVSSPQLDEPERGFSFLRDGPLDMRMDRSCGMCAADLVNDADESRLAEIFREYGEEPQARRIARAIVEARGRGTKFSSTLELADMIERTVGRHGAHHPATRVFQALRMAVNDEVGSLERALEGGLALLASGGRFAVITFESLTDRTVKRFFAGHVGKMRSLQAGGEVWEGALPRARAVTRKAVTATEMELKTNPRARSAKLRVIEKEAA